jgi:hypothetical protein
MFDVTVLGVRPRAPRAQEARNEDKGQVLPAVPDVGADDDAFRDGSDQWTNLEIVLQLNITPSQQLLASLFILAPLISAVMTSFVPKPT